MKVTQQFLVIKSGTHRYVCDCGNPGCDSPPKMRRVLLVSSYPIDASLRGGGAGPESFGVRFIHCSGGTGVLVEMVCAKPALVNARLALIRESRAVLKDDRWQRCP